MFRNNDLSVSTGYILSISARSNAKPFLNKDNGSYFLRKTSTYNSFTRKAQPNSSIREKRNIIGAHRNLCR
jgi:hypothetical protein